MALLNAPKIANLALALLQRQIVLPATVTRTAEADHDPPAGKSVTIRVPVPRQAREQVTPAATITLDPLNEVPVEVVLKHLYDAAPISDEDRTLSIVDFGRQVLAPQVEAVARAAEDEVADVLNAFDPDGEIMWSAEPDVESDIDVLLQIRERLTVNGCPPADRFCAVSPDVATRLLATGRFVEADKRGDGGTALTEATLGKLYGLNVVETPALDTGSAVGYHKSAVALGLKVPVTPAGVNGHTVVEDVLGLRWVDTFIPERLASASIVSIFAGCAPITEDGDDDVQRAIRVVTEEEGS